MGDAGDFKDPVTTPGMTDALRDAQLLADAVVATSSGQLLTAAVSDELDHLNGLLRTGAVAAAERS